MKIIAFRIKNYRSIIDSGKCFLSPDNITALIGQNESGKTSVLEALKSFYDGNITDDVMRSDLSFPEITCTFALDEEKSLGELLSNSTLPAELIPELNSRNEVSITRKWLPGKKNVIFVCEPEIIEFFKLQDNNRLSDSDKIVTSIKLLTQDLQKATLNSEEIKRKIQPFEKDLAQKSKDKSKSSEPEILTLREKLAELQDNLRQESSQMQHCASKLMICREFTDRIERRKQIDTGINTLEEQVKEGEYRLKASRSDRETRKIQKNIDALRESIMRLNSEKSVLEREIILKRKIASRVLDGKEINDAEQEANQEAGTEESYATPEMLAEEIWKYIPVFEFFEDFSSLLPNKIDLDDLLNENIHVEGYKAARNFLFIAGLNADFFREENHRILKQKIENLNSEITVDFQDYWRQNVGKNDKITINFELEHYDISQPDKSGKPYLEFWIKDKQERLYPKQRSRGVRWFLSFYLELKATAKSSQASRVMLIDEPGLSLHSRAQEDVLKVFEDLRQNLQIIYSTHSPNLIDLKKLYRVMAVQRARETDETSETLVLDSHSLNEASKETLSPIYALMGTRLNEKQFVIPRNNFIVEDAVTFHYLEAMLMLAGSELPAHFIPASDPSVIPTLANVLFGWKVDFGLLTMDNPVTRNISQMMRDNMFFTNGSAHKLIMVDGIESIEDLFSTIDFKRFIIKQRVGITIRNSEFIQMHQLSRMILVSEFHTRIKEENIQFSDFDEETRRNFTELFERVKNAVRES